MAKMKSHSATKKRFVLTNSGRLKHKQPAKNHKVGKKTAKRIRILRKEAYLEGTQAKTVKSMIQQ